jgi:hypothetical protein
MLYTETAPLKKHAKEAKNLTHVQNLKEETKGLVAEFSGREALDRFLRSARKLATSIGNDEGAKDYLKDLKEFILDTRDPNHVKSEEFTQQCRGLIKRGRKMVSRMRNNDQVDLFLNCGEVLINNITNNELITTLRERAGILVRDLTYEDHEGNRHLDTNLLGKLRQIIVPILAEALKYIPIPVISDKNDKQAVVVENIVLCAYDIIPENVYVHLESDSWLSLLELEAQKMHHSLVISLRNFHTEVKDIKFDYKRFSFPKLKEHGIVSVRLTGRGASVTIGFNIDQRSDDVVPKFTAGKVDFAIDKLDIEFDRSTLNHDVLVPLITSMFKRSIIGAIERGVEKNLSSAINNLGGRLAESLGETEPRFVRQLHHMTDTVKRGEFARTYRHRHEKLS